MQIYNGTAGWDDRSRILALALQTMEDETGPTGHPIADELDPMSNGWWKPEVVVNEAVAAIEQYRKDAKLEPGAMIYVRDTRKSDPLEDEG